MKRTPVLDVRFRRVVPALAGRMHPSRPGSLRRRAPGESCQTLVASMILRREKRDPGLDPASRLTSRSRCHPPFGQQNVSMGAFLQGKFWRVFSGCGVGRSEGRSAAVSVLFVDISGRYLPAFKVIRRYFGRILKMRCCFFVK